MKVLLVYFSGTGNTEKIANLYRAAFEAHGAEVESVSLPHTDPIDWESFDLIGFGYPIHAFNAPANVLRFAESVPLLLRGKRGFIFKSSGEPVRMSDVSSLKLISILKRKGITVRNEYQYCMPYNIIFRHSDAQAYRMWQTAQRVVPADVREILAGVPRLPRRVFLGDFLAWVLRVEHWGGRFNGKHYKVRESCIGCGKCEKICPTQNIHIDVNGHFSFGSNCLMCMRCSFLCPRDAIKIGFFEGWKVNGAYTFEPPAEDALPAKHEKYCEKAYRRYFREAEARIAAQPAE